MTIDMHERSQLIMRLIDAAQEIAIEYALLERIYQVLRSDAGGPRGNDVIEELVNEFEYIAQELITSREYIDDTCEKLTMEVDKPKLKPIKFTKEEKDSIDRAEPGPFKTEDEEDGEDGEES